MGSPKTTIDLYSAGKWIASINIIGDKTADWVRIVATLIREYPEVESVAVYNPKGEQIGLVTL